MIGNKISDKIAKKSKNSQQNNSETVTNENDKEIPKERYICPKETHKIIDEMRLPQYYSNGISKNNKFVIQIKQLNLRQKIV